MPSTGAENTLTSDKPRVMIANRGRDFEATGKRLTEWLAGRMPEAADLILANLNYPLGAGVSNETILFDATWIEGGRPVRRSFVLRLHPGSYQMFLDPGFERQIALIRALAAEGLLVPRIYWDEMDPAVLGNPFFVMEKVEGRVPVSHPVYNLQGWLYDAPVPSRRLAWEDAMRQMARVHAVPLEHVPFLDREGYDGDGFQQEFAYWKAAYHWAANGRSAPIIDQAIEWLEAHMPPRYETGLSWGDARIGNMIFGPDYKVAAMLDWEQASAAGGLLDLAWWLIMDRMFSEGIGVTRLDGLGTRQETIDLWTSLTGRSVEHLHWNEVFAAVRGAALVVRQAALRNSAPPMSNANNNLFTRELCKLMGWKPPADTDF